MSKELADENLKLTIIGTDMELTGDLYTSNDVRVDGKFFGNMHSTGKIVVSKNGTMAGNIKGVNVVIMGKAEGEFMVENNFQVLPESSFKGSVKTRYLHIADNAFFDGTCDISPNHEAIKVDQPKHRIDIESLEKLLKVQSAKTLIEIQSKIDEEVVTKMEEKPAEITIQELPETPKEKEIILSETNSNIQEKEEIDETEEKEPPVSSKSILSSKISQIKPL